MPADLWYLSYYLEYCVCCRLARHFLTASNISDLCILLCGQSLIKQVSRYIIIGKSINLQNVITLGGVEWMQLLETAKLNIVLQ